MNAGFSNLATLRAQLLAATLGAEPRFDTVLQSIGLGAAAAIQNRLQRQLARAVGTTEIHPADKCQFLLKRYPVETLTLIEYYESADTGWTPIDQAAWKTLDSQNGIVYFNAQADVGPYYAQVRFTYTGGFWWPTLEPDDDGQPETIPAGAYALPADLRLAWLLWCEMIWAQRDKLGLGLVDAPSAQSKIETLKMPEDIAGMLAQFVRWNLV